MANNKDSHKMLEEHCKSLKTHSEEQETSEEQKTIHNVMINDRKRAL